MDARSVALVRSFNQMVAERVGALEAQFLGRGRPYAESRILWEIGPEGADVRELRRRLGLDSGYLSRLLRSLESERLVDVAPSSADARVRHASLTARGRLERAELDRRADEVAWSLLAPLDQGRRDDLVAKMQKVERLLLASAVTLAVEDPFTPDARWCIQSYFEELNARFETGFDPGRGISADPDELVPPRGLLVIARLHGRPIGCGALKLHDAGPAELKRMWVSGLVRGLGVGRRLLQELEGLARERGAEVIRLETNHSLAEAIHLYRSSGYREVAAFSDEPYAHHWFEKRLG